MKRCTFAFALCILLARPAITYAALRSNLLSRHYLDGLSLARELQTYTGSRADLKVRTLPHWRRRAGRLLIEERVWARFVPSARGAGEIQLSPQLVTLLNRAARGYRTRADLLTLYVVLHECAHSLSPRAQKLLLSRDEAAREEAYARWRGKLMLRDLIQDARKEMA